MSLKTKFLSEVFATYDGSQLSPLWIYLNHGLLGSSCVSWIGPCNVLPSLMIDGEDFRENKIISSHKMVHFVAELFHIDLMAAIGLQRLMAEITKSLINSKVPNLIIERQGDDIFVQGKKLSISIATQSIQSCLIHFAVNITNQGTPLPTFCLNDLSLDPIFFAQSFLDQLKWEWDDMWLAYYKVRHV